MGAGGFVIDMVAAQEDALADGNNPSVIDTGLDGAANDRQKRNQVEDR